MIYEKLMKNRKAVLAVWNKAGMGKTSTLRDLVDVLRQAYPNSAPLVPTPPAVIGDGDIRWIINIDGLVVAIESRGDPKTNLKGRLIELVEKWNVDVIFCSTRTSGETVAAVENLRESYDFETIWTSTYQVAKNMHVTANAIKARHIIELMQSLGYLP